MRTLIVYDSLHGNTEKIARAIGSAIPGEVEVRRVGEVSPAELTPFDVLLVGSPTQGGKATPAIRDFIAGIPASALKGASVAAFDTRIPSKWVGIFGYAAGRIADALKKRGVTLVAPPEGFIVKGTEGPLKDGEIERAGTWAKGLISSAG